MVSNICSECGAEARVQVAQCPRCGQGFEATITESAPSRAPDSRSGRRYGTIAVCLAACAGITFWSMRTASVTENAVVVVGHVESAADGQTALHAQAASDAQP